MKAEIRADGRMHITAETELESYALRKWVADNMPVGPTNTMSCQNILFTLDPQDSRPSDGLDFRGAGSWRVG